MRAGRARRTPRCRGDGEPSTERRYTQRVWLRREPDLAAGGVRSVSLTRRRMCVGCRERSESGDLLRVVVEQGVLTPDPTARRAGRGAWLHPDCLEIAERRKAFTRALRVQAAPDPRVLRDFVAGMPNRATDVVDRRTDGSRADEPPMSTQP